jgi:hypothetical protein
MYYPSRKSSVICSAAAIFSVATVTAGIFIRRYLLARRASMKESLDSKEPSFMEDLVTHNTVGF